MNVTTETIRQILQEENRFFLWAISALGGLCFVLGLVIIKHINRVLTKLEHNDKLFEKQLTLNTIAIKILAKETGVDTVEQIFQATDKTKTE